MDTYLSLCANWINEDSQAFTLLDMGCRTMDLKPLLNSCTRYVGVDVVPGPNVVVCDAERPLPFEDKSFDIVTCLEVLEHLDNPHFAFKEILRVARKSVYVSLPNMYHFRFRLSFLRGFLSTKYRFHPDRPLDRHRWIMSYTEAARFVEHNSGAHKVRHKTTIIKRGRTRLVSTPIERRLARRWPDLFARELLSRIDKTD
jgi:SAM-dependent methyltransferase